MAEDAVQEAWLRYDLTPTRPRSPKAFLSAVVTRISIDVLRAARVRREQYVGDWLPEPLLTDPCEDPAQSTELEDSISMAALLLFERLSPLERAVFVLADRQARDKLVTRFFGAVRYGDVEGPKEVVAADVDLVGDAGGTAPAPARTIVGADKVARLLASLLPSSTWSMRPLEQWKVNGQPGVSSATARASSDAWGR